MENQWVVVHVRDLERLAKRLTAAQDLADNGLYGEGFGSLEAAVQLALDSFYAQEVTPAADESGGSAATAMAAYDDADVWAGVASHPLFPVDQ